MDLTRTRDYYRDQAEHYARVVAASRADPEIPAEHTDGLERIRAQWAALADELDTYLAQHDPDAIEDVTVSDDAMF